MMMAIMVHPCIVFAYKGMSHKAITNHVVSRTVLMNEELMAGMGFNTVIPEDVNSLLTITKRGEDQCNSVT